MTDAQVPDDRNAFGFLRARQFAADLRALIESRGTRDAPACAAEIRALADAISSAAGGREPVPYVLGRMEESVRRELEGEESASRPLEQWRAAVEMAVETARVGVERSLPDDYWRRIPRTDAEVELAAAADPDARLATREELDRAVRVQQRSADS